MLVPDTDIFHCVMDRTHQNLHLKRKLHTLQDDFAADQLVKAKLEKVDQQWCGIVVEQFVSDVLALVASHLELAKDMRAFRLTCTHWNLSFCDNMQLFVNRYWTKPSTIALCSDDLSVVVGILQFFYMVDYRSTVSVSQLYNLQGRLERFEYAGFQYWHMKDDLWMQTDGNGMKCIVAQRSGWVIRYCTHASDPSRRYDDARLGHTIEFRILSPASRKQTVYIGSYGEPHSNLLHYDNPCQAVLVSFQQQVIKMIAAADCIDWCVNDDEINQLSEGIQDAVRSWHEAMVQRNNPKDTMSYLKRRWFADVYL